MNVLVHSLRRKNLVAVCSAINICSAPGYLWIGRALDLWILL